MLADTTGDRTFDFYASNLFMSRRLKGPNHGQLTDETASTNLLESLPDEGMGHD